MKNSAKPSRQAVILSKQLQESGVPPKMAAAVAESILEAYDLTPKAQAA